MSLRYKLFLSFLFLGSLVGATSFYFIQSIEDMSAIVDFVKRVDVVSIQRVKSFREAFYRMQSAGRRFFDTGNAAHLHAIADLRAKCEDQLKKTFEVLDSAKEREAFSRLETGYKELNRLLDEDVEQVKRVGGGDAPNEHRRFQVSERVAREIHDLVKMSDESINTQVKRAQKIGARARQLGIGVVAIALATAIAFAWLIIRRISRPIEELGSATERVAAGEFEVRTTERGRDEIARLAQQFNRMATRLAELDGAKSAFIANVSHELRTPLTSIREANKLILDEVAGPVTEQQGQLLEISMEACDRLISLVKDVLDLSKMKAHAVPLKIEATGIDGLVEDCLSEFRLVAKSDGIAVEFSPDGEVPTVLVDRLRITQAISTLLTNARKFTSSGGRIVVSRRLDTATETGRSPSPANGDARRIVVSIADTGAGITPERLDDIRRRLDRGTLGVEGGLGLAIAHEVARAHGGELMIESVVGVGTTVRLSVPVASGETGTTS